MIMSTVHQGISFQYNYFKTLFNFKTATTHHLTHFLFAFHELLNEIYTKILTLSHILD